MESLSGRVDSLLSWLKDTETQMAQEADSTEEATIKENERTLECLMQKLQLVKVYFFPYYIY